MHENLLNALMELIALFARVNNSHFMDNAKELIRNYLDKTAVMGNYRLHVRKLYDYFTQYAAGIKEIHFHDDTLREHISRIINQIKGDLKEEDRMILFLSFLELIKLDNKIEDAELNFVNILSSELGLSQKDYQNGLQFILTDEINKDCTDIIEVSDLHTIDTEELEGAWIEENRPQARESTNHLYKEGLPGKFHILKLQGVNFLIGRFLGEMSCTINNKKLHPGKFFLINPFDQILTGNGIRLVYQELMSGFKSSRIASSLKFSGNNIQTIEDNQHAGISNFSFEEELGNLVIILCNDSGESVHITGVLSGQVKLSSGSIMFNGCDIFSERYKIHKMIGIVPRDPLFYADNSIFQNFTFSASLAFPHTPDFKIKQFVNQTITNLNLQKVAHIPVEKIKSEYPAEYLRTLINFGIELIRDPLIIILDLPFDHLSPSYSEDFCSILKKESHKGKLIMLTAINPNGCIMKKSDRLWIFDHKGYIIYRGLATDAINYFKHSLTHYLDSEEFCPVCGNLNIEQLYQIIQAKVFDDYGKPTTTRKTSPEKWHSTYKEKIEQKEIFNENKKVIPSYAPTIPNISVQFVQYFKRELAAWISSPLFSIILFSCSLLLSVILAGLMRNDWSGNFDYSHHENISLLLFLSISFCFGVGILKGYMATIRDKKLIQFEYLRNHMFFSFLNVKYISMILFSVFFSVLFTFIVDFISRISHMFISHWLIYLTITVSGGGLGMLAGYSRLSIKTAIALLLIFFNLNMLFSGYLLSFNSLPRQMSSSKYSPLIADLFPVRWAYEAIMVEEVRASFCSTRLFDSERIISDLSFKSSVLLPKFQEMIFNLKEKKVSTNLLPFEAKVLKGICTQFPDIYPFEYLEELNKPKPGTHVITELEDYLRYLQFKLYEKLSLAIDTKSILTKELKDSIGEKQYETFLKNNRNIPLLVYIQNKKSEKNYIINENEILQTDDPIFHQATNNYGRSCFFSSQKLMNGYYYNTLYFNLIVLFSLTVIIYLFTLTGSRRNL